LATTNKTAWSWVVAQGPNVEYAAARRAGLIASMLMLNRMDHFRSAGIDMALGFIETLSGQHVVSNTQVLMEYRWTDDPAYDPFCLRL